MSITNEHYHKLEQLYMNGIALIQHISERIAEKLEKEPQEIERAIYQACVSTDTKPPEATMLIHEFLVALQGHRKEEEETTDEQ